MTMYRPTVSGTVLVAAVALAILWAPQSTLAADRMVVCEPFMNTG